jgi:predicted AlkP superfamily pyrophosphatase or phosphodiesterase
VKASFAKRFQRVGQVCDLIPDQVTDLTYLYGKRVRERSESATVQWVRIILALLLFTSATVAAQTPNAHRALLLISIDGLRPDYVLEADRHGLKVPNLRSLVRDGTYATSVRGVLPTATYPSHTTIVTGVSPAKHGIVGNKPFGAAVKDLDVWYSYAEDLRAPTLWDAATRAGYVVGSVSWPVTVGATAIRFNIPEFNLTRTPEDVKITRGVATPGLMAELEPKAGPYLTEVADAVKRDWARTRYAVEMIRQKHVRFITVHVAASDSIQHRSGPFAAELWPALEEIDRMVGELAAAIRAEDPKAAVSVVSDHGFAPVTNVLWLDAAFVRAGLITLKTQGTTVEASGVSEWIAQTWPAGGSAAIVLKNPLDQAAREKVKSLLDQLAVDPANGIAAILDEAEIRKFGGAPSAQFWVDMKPGFMVSPTLQKTIVSVVSARGTHGYSPVHPEMGATFMIAGEGIRAGHNLGAIDMRSIAPTLAKIMGVPFPSAEVPAIDIFKSRAGL